MKLSLLLLFTLAFNPGRVFSDVLVFLILTQYILYFRCGTLKTTQKNTVCNHASTYSKRGTTARGASGMRTDQMMCYRKAPIARSLDDAWVGAHGVLPNKPRKRERRYNFHQEDRGLHADRIAGPSSLTR